MVVIGHRVTFRKDKLSFTLEIDALIPKVEEQSKFCGEELVRVQDTDGPPRFPSLKARTAVSPKSQSEAFSASFNTERPISVLLVALKGAAGVIFGGGKNKK